MLAPRSGQKAVRPATSAAQLVLQSSSFSAPRRLALTSRAGRLHNPVVENLCIDTNACASGSCDHHVLRPEGPRAPAPRARQRGSRRHVVTASGRHGVETDGCADDPCHVQPAKCKCAENKAPATGFECGACPAGWAGDRIAKGAGSIAGYCGTTSRGRGHSAFCKGLGSNQTVCYNYMTKRQKCVMHG